MIPWSYNLCDHRTIWGLRLNRFLSPRPNLLNEVPHESTVESDGFHLCSNPLRLR
jgi:hypothetical protein